MKKNILLFFTFLFGLQLCACGGATNNSLYDSFESPMPSALGSDFGYSSKSLNDASIYEEGIQEESIVETEVAQNNTKKETSILEETQRKLIKDVSMTVETNEFEKCLEDLNREIISMGGYIEESNIYGFSMYSNNNGTRDAYYKIRIPQNKVDTFVNYLDGDTNVLEKKESIKDITLEYVDFESRKNSLLAEEQRLIELLEKAENLTDVIQLEDKLSEIRYEIDRIESSLRTFDSLVSYSTITLNIKEVKDYTKIKTIEITPLDEMEQGFEDSINNIKERFIDIIIFIVSIIPYLFILLIVLLIVFIIIKIIFKDKNKKRKENVNDKKEKQKEEHLGKDFLEKLDKVTEQKIKDIKKE